jgi:hypothetical protein
MNQNNTHVNLDVQILYNQNKDKNWVLLYEDSYNLTNYQEL